MINQKIVGTVEELQIASRNIPKIWDGRNSILEMRDAGSRQWRQMEWMGFYFEFLCEKHFDGIIDIPGKKYGRTEFDAFREISWDFKTHAANTTNHNVITNDAEAVANTIDDYGHYGLILAIGEVEYNDEERTFKRWHDELKEGISKYEVNRINRRAMSRRRKTEFILSEIHFVCFDTETLSQCGGSFQKGFRNADGSPRREKVADKTNILRYTILTKVWTISIRLRPHFQSISDFSLGSRKKPIQRKRNTSGPPARFRRDEISIEMPFDRKSAL